MTRGQRAFFWLGDVAADVVVALLVYWPINTMCIRKAIDAWKHASARIAASELASTP